MRLQYKSAFIIPSTTKKIFSKNGWKFEIENYLPDFTNDFLVNVLKLKLNEVYLGIMNYDNELFQASVFLDDRDRIEHVYIKVFGNNLDLLLTEFNKSSLHEYAELFIPD